MKTITWEAIQDFFRDNISESRGRYLAVIGTLSFMGWVIPPFTSFWLCFFFIFWKSPNKVLARAAWLGPLGLFTIFRVLTYFSR